MGDLLRLCDVGSHQGEVRKLLEQGFSMESTFRFIDNKTSIRIVCEGEGVCKISPEGQPLYGLLKNYLD